jgi:hypothetical protein
MQLDAKAIAAEVENSVRQVQPARASAAAMEAVPADFGGIWQKAKPILELLSGIAMFIPGVGSTAGAVLKALIKVGDQVASQVCH